MYNDDDQITRIRKSLEGINRLMQEIHSTRGETNPYYEDDADMDYMRDDVEFKILDEDHPKFKISEEGKVLPFKKKV